jgi:hypothetical protein
VLLSVPYAAKNILMGLSEWLTVSLIIGAVYFHFFRKSLLVAIILLALFPFFRQNALPVVLFLFFLFVNRQKNQIAYIFVFLGFLLLPLYHNLYYAGEWRFFTSIFQWPFLNYETSSALIKPTAFSFFHLFNNCLHYIGIDIKGTPGPDFMEESFLFLWVFLFLFVYMGRTLHSKLSVRFFYLSTGILVLLPGILLATDFYPRFEFVNIYLILAVFLTLYKSDKSISVIPGFHKKNHSYL